MHLYHNWLRRPNQTELLMLPAPVVSALSTMPVEAATEDMTGVKDVTLLTELPIDINRGKVVAELFCVVLLADELKPMVAIEVMAVDASNGVCGETVRKSGVEEFGKRLMVVVLSSTSEVEVVADMEIFSTALCNGVDVVVEAATIVELVEASSISEKFESGFIC